MHRLDNFAGPELMQMYKNVFATAEGQMVLSHMLVELGFTSESPDMTAEDMAHRNYATRLMTIIGGGEIGVGATKLLIKGLISQPIPKQKQED